MTPPLPLEEAQARMLGAVAPLGTEELEVEGVAGRWLAADLVARRTRPAADLSSMDGYAICAEDRAGPWRIVGESAAGHPYPGTLSAGEAVRISTGAIMPAGAGAVLVQEEALVDGATLTPSAGGEPSARFIRRKGFDFASGEVLLTAGTRIGPAQLALALAAGHGTLPVHRLPSIALLDCGDELAANPADCPAHLLPASNGAMLAAMVAPFVRCADRIGPIPDRLEALLTALDQCADADVIVTSGGASVGDHDLVRPALAAWGPQIDFWRIAVKPGKPMLVARRGAQWIIGLPGNPVSAHVTAFLFLLPLLRRLGGAAADAALPLNLAARTAAALPAGGTRREFLRASYDGSTATPVASQDSSALRSLALANALIDRPAGAGALAAGEAVSIYLLENGGIA